MRQRADLVVRRIAHCLEPVDRSSGEPGGHFRDQAVLGTSVVRRDAPHRRKRLEQRPARERQSREVPKLGRKGEQ